jgi:hypothetical protein
MRLLGPTEGLDIDNPRCPFYESWMDLMIGLDALGKRTKEMLASVVN